MQGLTIKKLKWLVTLLSFIYSMTLSAQTLIQVVQKTIKTNPTILAAKAGQVSAEESFIKTKSGYYPDISVDAAQGRERTDSPSTRGSGRDHVYLQRRERGFDLKQMMFDGGATFADVASQEHLLASAAFNYADKRNDIVAKTVQAYLDVLRQQKLVRLARINVRVHKDTLKQVDIKYKSGAGRIVDTQLVASRKERAEDRLVQLKDALELAKIKFKKLTGFSPAALRQPRSVSRYLPRTLNQAEILTMRNNMSVAQSKASLGSKHALVKSAQAKYFPTVDFELKAGHDNDTDGTLGRSNDLTAMFVAKMNLFKGFSDWHSVKQSRADELEAQEKYAQAKRDAMESIRLDWEGLLTSKSREKVVSKQVKHAGDVVASLNKQFEFGKVELFDLLDAETELFNARVAYTNSQFDRLTNEYKLLKDTYTLLPVLNKSQGRPNARTRSHKKTRRS